jgi:hypothetical protein
MQHVLATDIILNQCRLGWFTVFFLFYFKTGFFGLAFRKTRKTVIT